MPLAPTIAPPPEEIFHTSALNAAWHGVREARDAFADGTRKLGTRAVCDLDGVGR